MPPRSLGERRVDPPASRPSKLSYGRKADADPRWSKMTLPLRLYGPLDEPKVKCVHSEESERGSDVCGYRKVFLTGPRFSECRQSGDCCQADRSEHRRERERNRAWRSPSYRAIQPPLHWQATFHFEAKVCTQRHRCQKRYGKQSYYRLRHETASNRQENRLAKGMSATGRSSPLASNPKTDPRLGRATSNTSAMAAIQS